MKKLYPTTGRQHASDRAREHEPSRREFLARSGGLLALAAAGPPLALSACGDDGGGGDSDTIRIAFSHPTSEIPIVRAIRRVASRTAKAGGCEMIFDATTGGNLEEQRQTVESWITQGIPAMCVFPTEKEAFEPLAQRAMDNGLIWTTYAEPSELSYGGVIFRLDVSGQLVGEEAVRWINENNPQAKVLIHTFTGVPFVAPRAKMPEKLISEQTDATIVAMQDAPDGTEGLRVTEDILKAHPDLSVVIGINDESGLGAARAFRNAGKDPAKTFVCGQDGSDQALETLKQDDHFKATAALQVDQIGRGIVTLNKKLVEAGPPEDGKREEIEITPILVKTGEADRIEELLKPYRDAS